MEITGHLMEGPAELGDLLHRPLKELVVVGFEMNFTRRGEDFAVLIEEIMVGQAALGLILLRPRVAEVDIDAVYLAAIEHLAELRRVAVDEVDILQASLTGALHSHHHGIGDFLHSDQQHVGLGGGGVHREATLAAAQLQTHLFGLGHKVMPVTLLGAGICNEPVGTGSHSRL